MNKGGSLLGDVAGWELAIRCGVVVALAKCSVSLFLGVLGVRWVTSSSVVAWLTGGGAADCAGGAMVRCAD